MKDGRRILEGLSDAYHVFGGGMRNCASNGGYALLDFSTVQGRRHSYDCESVVQPWAGGRPCGHHGGYVCEALFKALLRFVLF